MNISQTYNSKTQKRLTCLLFCTHVASITHPFHKLETIQRAKARLAKARLAKARLVPSRCVPSRCVPSRCVPSRCVPSRCVPSRCEKSKQLYYNLNKY